MISASLKTLPDVHFADPDAGALETAILAAYERLAGVRLQPGDPVRLFLESLAYALSVQNGIIDLAGRQNLLAYATGAHLDHLGAPMGVERIAATPARCVLRFSIGSALTFSLPIPEGTRASTADGRVVFATIGPAEIAPGDLYADAPALAVEAGPEASGLAPGQISRLVDPLPYIISVANTEATVDGAAAEDDERLRERIRLAPESFTVAGSSGQYIARTLAISSDILAVSVGSPEPGVVDVRFILTGGELPDAAMIAMVQAGLSAADVRPLTDTVRVGAPDVVEYSIAGSWYLKREDAAMLSTVTAKVETAVAEYVLWQRSAPGRDINPSRLIAAIQDAGAKRVELDAPAFQALQPTEIARETDVEITFGGLEDE